MRANQTRARGQLPVIVRRGFGPHFIADFTTEESRLFSWLEEQTILAAALGSGGAGTTRGSRRGLSHTPGYRGESYIIFSWPAAVLALRTRVSAGSLYHSSVAPAASAPSAASTRREPYAVLVFPETSSSPSRDPPAVELA
jgi:hypothetical protein